MSQDACITSIAGTGSYLPEKVLRNSDLEKMVDTSDEWIRTRTGIDTDHLSFFASWSRAKSR